MAVKAFEILNALLSKRLMRLITGFDQLSVYTEPVQTLQKLQQQQQQQQAEHRRLRREK